MENVGLRDHLLTYLHCASATQEKNIAPSPRLKALPLKKSGAATVPVQCLVTCAYCIVILCCSFDDIIAILP